MDIPYWTVYFQCPDLTFPFSNVFGLRMMVFQVLIAFSAYFLAPALRLQGQKRESSKKTARNVILWGIAQIGFWPKPMKYKGLETATLPKPKEYQ